MENGKSIMLRREIFIAGLFLFCLLISVALVTGDAPYNKVTNIKAKYGEISLVTGEENLIVESDINPNYMFKQIFDLKADSNGNIYILDEKKIIKFNPDGKFLTRIGRIGQGPGEYMSPIRLFIDSNNNLYVLDQGVLISKFDQRGNFINLIRLKFTIPFFPLKSRDFYVENNNIFALSREYTEEGCLDILVRASIDGQVINKITSYLNKNIRLEMDSKSGGGVAGAVYTPYSAGCYFCLSPHNKLYYGENLAYKIFVYDEQGRLDFIFSKEEKLKPITNEEKIKYRDIKSFYLPPHRPFFQDLLCDEKGRIYVIRVPYILEKIASE
ncbi:MAG: 6-bladed beta-propeller [Sulfolobaceae archaeon]